MPENSGEISLKSLILTFKQWVSYLLSKWLVLMFAGLIGGALAFLYVHNSKTRYIGELNFVLSGSSSASGLAGLAGLAGVNLSNTSGDGAFEGDNIIELLKSQRIIKRSLFQLLPDGSDVLINLFISESGMREAWDKNAYIKKYLPFPKSISAVNPVQDSLIVEIQAALVKGYINVGKADKKLNFYNVKTKTTNELLSVVLTKSLVSEATNFYIETKTKTANDNLNMLKHEADSLRTLLGSAVNSAAQAADQTFNLNAALQVNRTGMQKSQVQAQVLVAAYGEVVKNLEIAKITLQKETPLVQIIDSPFIPLKALRKSALIYSIAGFIFFAGLLGGFLIGSKVINEILTR